MPDAPRIVLVSGSPGSGKTTVAATLAASEELGVHLESDWFYRFITGGFIPPHLPESHTQNSSVIDITVDAVAGYASAGYTVYWDGVLGPWFLDRIARRLASRGFTAQYLVLRAPREASLDRVRQRDGTLEASGAEKMFDQFADLGEYESHVVASGGPKDEVVDACRDALAGGALQLPADNLWVDDRWPVSVKGVLSWGDEFVVLKNRRGEWELPGGRLDATDASPTETVAREFKEELGLDVFVGELIDSWIYDVAGKRVLIVTYACSAERPPELSHSDEHVEVAALTREELKSAADSDRMPAGYLASINAQTRGTG